MRSCSYICRGIGKARDLIDLSFINHQHTHAQFNYVKICITCIIHLDVVYILLILITLYVVSWQNYLAFVIISYIYILITYIDRGKWCAPKGNLLP